uniref:Calcineurin-like phosphoesterase domain-containing protein n=1 Tax=Arion vulgaris TaxID=1028688 RepID=A0A0B7AH84_9EUPU
MVVLLVSDPQLIGIQDEVGFPLGPIIRWDADSYLRKTFSRVYHHTAPDVIVFLGDIMDEGSKATESEYQSYVHRFNSIFYEKSYVKTIVIPGDNDVGGEGGDVRTVYKVSRFEKHFENMTGVITHGFIDFLKLDIIMMRDQVLEKQKIISDVATQLKSTFRIIVNHESMITKPKSSIYSILRMAQPNILLTGHWHLSQMFGCDTCLSDDEDMTNWPYYQRDISKVDGYVDIDLTNLIALSEIMVPTCSYRMGVPNMGYGVAVINKTGKMKYTVLWLPARYTLLYIYLMMLAVVAVILIVHLILSPARSRKWPYR